MRQMLTSVGPFDSIPIVTADRPSDRFPATDHRRTPRRRQLDPSTRDQLMKDDLEAARNISHIVMITLIFGLTLGVVAVLLAV